MIRLHKAEQAADVRCTDGAITYQEREENRFIAFVPCIFTCPLCGIRLTGCNDRKQTDRDVDFPVVNILQYKKQETINRSTMNMAARTVYSSAAAGFLYLSTARTGVQLMF